MAAMMNHSMEDHDHHGGSDDCGGVGMRMTLHGGYCETLLFDGWKIRSAFEMFGSCLAVIAIGLVFELLKHFREHYWMNEPPPKPNTNKMFNWIHLYMSVLHMVQYSIGYSLMLVTMTFNCWLILAVLLGGFCGYLVGKTRWPGRKSDTPPCKLPPYGQ